tara:strand:- start:19 stop:276 length:258 start_codon:yes stop_codon:yes gene_type:complete
MPNATFELPVEIDAKFHKVHDGYEGDNGEPASPSEVDITYISLNGIRIFPDPETDKLTEELYKKSEEEIYENLPDLMQQNAPDSD